MHADFAQIELFLGDDGDAPDSTYGITMASDAGPEGVTLTVPRQYGAVDAVITLHSEEPPLDEAWQSVAEFPLQAGSDAELLGFARAGDVQLELPVGAELRARYVVEDAEAACQYDEDGEGATNMRVLLQFWPAEARPGAVVRSIGSWSRYWTWGSDCPYVVRELAEVPEPERLRTLLDSVISARVGVAAQILAGEERPRKCVTLYAEELFTQAAKTHDAEGAGVYAEYIDDRAALNELIDERAAVASR